MLLASRALNHRPARGTALGLAENVLDLRPGEPQAGKVSRVIANKRVSEAVCRVAAVVAKKRRASIDRCSHFRSEASRVD